jgi:hypothetical protein
VKLWPTGRGVIRVVTLLLAGLMGLATSAFVVPAAGPGASFPLAGLAAGALPPCEDRLVPWARNLVANRAALGDDDFAVEAAVTLSLLRESSADPLSGGERQALNDGASRCPSVLHMPCDDTRFEMAITRRCSPPETHALHADAGATPCPDAAPNEEAASKH